MKKTTYMDTQSSIQRTWLLIDVKGKILGDAAVEIAHLLMGKHKTTYTPHLDGGDYVVVINATEIAVTGKKKKDKMYYRHSGFPGGLRSDSFETVMEKDPAYIIEHAVKGMLPKNKLRAPRMKRLHVFPTAEHTYKDKFAA